MTIAPNPTETYLDNEMSGRLRQLLRNTCDLNGVAVRQLKLAWRLWRQLISQHGGTNRIRAPTIVGFIPGFSRIASLGSPK